MEQRKRVEYIDVAKGIAIWLVVIGHTISSQYKGVMLNRWIYSFHMPLFFILSGYFFKERAFKITLKKAVCGLLVPYFIINGIKCVVGALWGWSPSTILDKYILPMLYGNGAPKYGDMVIFPVKAIGMTWFLLALFWCHILYYYMYRFSRELNISTWIPVIAVFLFGIELTKKVWLPWSVQAGMGALLFYQIGVWMKKKDIFEKDWGNDRLGIYICAAVLWLLSVRYESIGMHANSYKGVGVIIGAAVGTYFTVQFSKYLLKVPYIGEFFRWCGNHSIIIYGFHALDAFLLTRIEACIMRIFVLPGVLGTILYCLIRISLILLGSFLVLRIKSCLESRYRSAC